MNDRTKIILVFLLGVITVILGIYFYLNSPASFSPGPSVDSATFKNIFQSASDVAILMDVRGVDDTTKRNILQCGVDFAGSSGFGGKNVSYLSVGDEGCVAVDGMHPEDFCFSSLKNHIAIYVKEGNSSTYHTNGMVVGVGKTYPLNTCAIRKI